MYKRLFIVASFVISFGNLEIKPAESPNPHTALVVWQPDARAQKSQEQTPSLPADRRSSRSERQKRQSPQPTARTSPRGQRHKEEEKDPVKNLTTDQDLISSPAGQGSALWSFASDFAAWTHCTARRTMHSDSTYYLWARSTPEEWEKLGPAAQAIALVKAVQYNTDDLTKPKGSGEVFSTRLKSFKDVLTGEKTLDSKVARPALLKLAILKEQIAELEGLLRPFANAQDTGTAS